MKGHCLRCPLFSEKKITFKSVPEKINHAKITYHIRELELGIAIQQLEEKINSILDYLESWRKG